MAPHRIAHFMVHDEQPQGKEARELVCIVEDDEVHANILALMLEPQYDVMVLASAAGALEAIAERRPDLLLLDAALPDADALALCRRLKSEPATEMLPVVFITAPLQHGEQSSFFEAGADDYVAIPVHRTTLNVRIRRILDNRVYAALLESMVSAQYAAVAGPAKESHQSAARSSRAA